MHRLAFDAADRRKGADIEVGVPGGAAANRLFQHRLRGERRGYLEGFRVGPAVAFYSTHA
jgi:hypothetical protein